MITFPAEIIICITARLRLKDKLECIRVCKAWYNAITPSELYEELVLECSIDNIKDVLDFFASRETLAELVQSVSIIRLNVDFETILLLSRLFRNLKSFQWLEELEGRHLSKYLFAQSSSSKPEIPPEAFQQWKNIESIVNHPRNSYLVEHLLSSCICKRLRSIEISLCRQFQVHRNREDSANIERLRSLIALLHQAPSLEKLTLKYTAITLSDMENLHLAAPGLKRLALDHVRFHNESMTSYDIDMLQAVNSMESFSLVFIPQSSPWNEQQNADTINPWIQYIGNKYAALKTLSIFLNFDLSSVKQFIANTLLKLTYLDSYKIVGCALDDDLLNIMDNNQVQLKHIYLSSDTRNPRSLNRMETFVSHSSVQNIQHVEFDDRTSWTDNHASQHASLTLHYLTNMFYTFKNLSHLTLTSEIIILMQLLQLDLGQLQHLSCTFLTDPLHMWPDRDVAELDTKMIYLTSAHVRKNKIHKLEIDLTCTNVFRVYHKRRLQNAFDNILQSCIYIRSFKLIGSMHPLIKYPAKCDLYLDLFQHVYIRQILINTSNLLYYTMVDENNVEEKWQCYHHNRRSSRWQDVTENPEEGQQFPLTIKLGISKEQKHKIDLELALDGYAFT